MTKPPPQASALAKAYTRQVPRGEDQRDNITQQKAEVSLMSTWSPAGIRSAEPKMSTEATKSRRNRERITRRVSTRTQERKREGGLFEADV